MTAVDRPDNGQDECPHGCGGTGVRQFDSDGWEACPHLIAEVASGRARAGEQQREAVARWLQQKVVARDRGVAQLMGWEKQPQEFREGWLSWADELLELLGLDADTLPCPSTLTVTEDGITAVVHCLAGPGHEKHGNQGRTW